MTLGHGPKRKSGPKPALPIQPILRSEVEDDADRTGRGVVPARALGAGNDRRAATQAVAVVDAVGAFVIQTANVTIEVATAQIGIRVDLEVGFRAVADRRGTPESVVTDVGDDRANAPCAAVVVGRHGGDAVAQAAALLE